LSAVGQGNTQVYAQSSGENEPNGASIEATDAVYHELYTQLKSGRRIETDQTQKEYITPKQPTVYLTFDDGPSTLTPKVLDILHDEGVKASFFVLGNMAEEHPEYIKRIVSDGHTLGNHTYNHVYKELYGDFKEFWRQIQKTQGILNDIVGFKPELLRAPGGTYTNFDAFYYYYLGQAGYTVMDWNMDSADSTRADISAAEIVESVKKSKLKHEVILLMHDGTGHSQTVKALPEIIHYFKKQGYAFAPLTLNVKPAQFPVSKGKWNRSQSFEQFTGMEQIVAQYAEEHNKEIAIEKQKAENLRLLALRPTTPLTIVIDQQSQILQPQDYDFSQGKFMVPLHALIAQMGGHLQWDNVQDVVTAYYGLRKVEFDLPRHTIRSYAANGHLTTFGMQTFKLYHGILEVPLRSTIEMLGNYISGYNVDEGGRAVQIYSGFTTQLITDFSGIQLDKSNLAPIGENSLLLGLADPQFSDKVKLDFADRSLSLVLKHTLKAHSLRNIANSF
jgi:peptidoglycan/xylan/chitin deacetylase (PgdA/CDA1 family)